MGIGICYKLILHYWPRKYRNEGRFHFFEYKSPETLTLYQTAYLSPLQYRGGIVESTPQLKTHLGEEGFHQNYYTLITDYTGETGGRLAYIRREKINNDKLY